MSMISEQVKKLREFSKYYSETGFGFYRTDRILREAADTIESLSAKLSAANMERSERHYGELGIIKVNSDVRKELVEQHNKAFELINKMPLKGNEVWQGYVGGVMQTLGALIDDIEKPESIGGGWIACKDRLPEDETKVLVWFEYFRYGEYNRLFQTIGISYMYDGKWSGFVNGESGWNELRIIAWQPLPSPYKEDRS